jgi:predicted nucleotidyltransferase
VKFGLSEKEWAMVMDLVVKPLQNQGCKVFIFGSRARGDHKKFSDLDLLYESAKPLSLGKIGVIQSNIEESNLPIKVDLVNLEELANSYKENVLRDRTLIKAGS